VYLEVAMAQRANGEGTIVRRKDGRYHAAAYVHVTDGTRRRVYVYGRDRRDVAAKLDALIQQDRTGVPQPRAEMTIAQYLDHWLEAVVASRVRPLTLRTYEIYIREHIKPALGRKRLRHLTAADVRVFLTQVRTQPSRSPGSQAKVLSPRTVAHLHAILRKRPRGRGTR
jgi:hypothetical protein